MNELGYPIQACDITGSVDVYYADDVIFLLDEKDKRIVALEKELLNSRALGGDVIYITKSELAIRDLEQQAKGLTDYANSQEQGMTAVWMLSAASKLIERAKELEKSQ